MRAYIRGRIGLAGLVWLTAAGLSAAAAGEPGGISVSATATTQVKPDQLEIDVRVGGSAELTGDALTKFRDSAGRLRSAIERLNIKNLTVESRGLEMKNPGAAGGAAAAIMAMNNPELAPKSGVEIGEQLRLIVTGLDTLKEEELADLIVRLMDTLRDAGGVVGDSGSPSLQAMMMGAQSASSLVRFVVSDGSSAAQRARQLAMKQAKEKAETLASLADVKLGKVISIAEGAPPANTGSVQERMISAIYGIGEKEAEVRLITDRMTSLPVTVTLTVTYAIE